LYNYIRRKAVKFSKSDLPEDVYKHAMVLMSFPWLNQEDGDVDKLLQSAAEQGHAPAKFEYGLKLYREQKDIKQAIYWISQATKQGNSRAQYRLARILLDSPWVVNDAKKALFWLQKASKQNHHPAKLMLAEVKLLAKDDNLHDVDSAQLYLHELSDEQESNPQYHYLQAIAYAKVEPRQLSQAVIYIREAIALGEYYNWNVEAWEQQLIRWTSGGSVTIQEL
jgi:TPR repeat protein